MMLFLVLVQPWTLPSQMQPLCLFREGVSISVLEGRGMSDQTHNRPHVEGIHRGGRQPRTALATHAPVCLCPCPAWAHKGHVLTWVKACWGFWAGQGSFCTWRTGMGGGQRPWGQGAILRGPSLGGAQEEGLLCVWGCPAAFRAKGPCSKATALARALTQLAGVAVPKRAATCVPAISTC